MMLSCLHLCYQSGSRSRTCSAPGCMQPEDLEHILLCCAYYEQVRTKLRRLWSSSKEPSVHDLLQQTLVGPSHQLVQFILDPLIHPMVITLTQKLGPGPLMLVSHLTRSWCFSIHNMLSKPQPQHDTTQRLGLTRK